MCRGKGSGRNALCPAGYSRRWWKWEREWGHGAGQWDALAFTALLKIARVTGHGVVRQIVIGNEVAEVTTNDGEQIRARGAAGEVSRLEERRGWMGERLCTSQTPFPTTYPPRMNANADRSAAMVLSRSVGALRAFDPVNSIDVLVSGGMRSGSTFNIRRTSANIDPEVGPLGVRREASFASRGLVGGNTGGLTASLTGSKQVCGPRLPISVGCESSCRGRPGIGTMLGAKNRRLKPRGRAQRRWDGVARSTV